jgi:sterol 3beta-glucosyltransferase
MTGARILVMCYGTRGDVEPYVALSLGLQARGHEVTLATARQFGAWVASFGVPFAPLTDSAIDVIHTSAGKALVEGAGGPLRRVVAGGRLARAARRGGERLIEDARAVAEGVAPDVIVYHPKVTAAPHIAEGTGCAAVMGLLQPIVLPTEAFPPTGLPPLSVPGYNRMAYRLVSATYTPFRKAVNRFRKAAFGLPPICSGQEVILPPGLGTIPILHAVSPAVIPRPPDWPAQAHLTGYWQLPRDDGFTPPPALARFLAEGPPPVYVGFGSMVSETPEALRRTVTEALRRAGMRGVVASGWAGFEEGEHDGVLVIPPVPHGWLFPRMAAVVHHGGAGTTANGFAAGVPCVICPFFGDQPGWARRSVALGVGATPVPRKALDAGALSASIREAVTRPELAANARALADRLQQEDGVGTAAGLIEAELARVRPGMPAENA